MIFLKKKAQMQLSVGMMVIVVLSVLALVLGVYLTNQIFSSAATSVDSIDQAIKNEINKLFSEDDSRKVVIYPSSRKIKIKKGNDDYLGFAFSIRNIETTEGEFTYEVFVNDPNIRENCNINVGEAEGWIKLGRTGSLNIPPGTSMTDPEFVRFLIPDNAPPCAIRYGINIEKNRLQYGSTLSIDLEVQSS